MTNNPIQLAKQTTPWWMMEIRRFDGLEIHPVRNLYSPEDDKIWCEPCEPGEAEFWSVYGHSVDGGIECFEDFDTDKEACTFATTLLAIYPHLLKFGL